MRDTVIARTAAVTATTTIMTVTTTKTTGRVLRHDYVKSVARRNAYRYVRTESGQSKDEIRATK